MELTLSLRTRTLRKSRTKRFVASARPHKFALRATASSALSDASLPSTAATRPWRWKARGERGREKRHEAHWGTLGSSAATASCPREKFAYLRGHRNHRAWPMCHRRPKYRKAYGTDVNRVAFGMAYRGIRDRQLLYRMRNGTDEASTVSRAKSGASSRCHEARIPLATGADRGGAA